LPFPAKVTATWGHVTDVPGLCLHTTAPGPRAGAVFVCGRGERKGIETINLTSKVGMLGVAPQQAERGWWRGCGKARPALRRGSARAAALRARVRKCYQTLQSTCTRYMNTACKPLPQLSPLQPHRPRTHPAPFCAHKTRHGHFSAARLRSQRRSSVPLGVRWRSFSP
jgi:hypothetical protein